MPNPTHEEILKELPERYRNLVDQGTARGQDLDKAIIGALAVMAKQHPRLFKKIQNKLERKNKK